MLAKDKEFLAWRAEHSESYRPAARESIDAHETVPFGRGSRAPQHVISTRRSHRRPVRRFRGKGTTNGASHARCARADRDADRAWRPARGDCTRIPVQTDNVFLALIALKKPVVFHVLTYGYATLWFTTAFLAASLVTSVFAIVAFRYPGTARLRPLPPYPEPASRPTPTLVLGERHFARALGPAPTPRGSRFRNAGSTRA